ncbi:glycosyltransferase [Candidatus Woesearchaeota archaeon]|nr:glycosyltransferase [Candidatus Woesearchaeota archaeon]
MVVIAFTLYRRDNQEQKIRVKQLNLIKEAIKEKHEYGVLSILREKEKNNEENHFFVAKTRHRKLVQGLMLPFYILRLSRKYDIFHFLWTPSSIYHRLIIKLCKLLRKKVVFTVISGYDKNYNHIKNSNLIIVQSTRMKEHLIKNFGLSSELIYPGVDLENFKPGNKSRTILFAGMPYRNELLNSRCVFELLLGFKRVQEDLEDIHLILVFRGGETEKTVRDFIEKNQIKNVGIISGYVDLSGIMSRAGIVTNIYRGIIPDMPLSGVEGICSGCVLLTAGGSGLADLTIKANASILVKADEKSIADGIVKAFKNMNKIGNNALKLRELFDKERFKRESLKIYEMI